MTDLTHHPRHVRVGTIVWGAILVAVATIAILILLFGPLGPTGLLWTIVGFGSILVLGAIAAGIVRAARRNRGEPAATTPWTEPATTTAITEVFPQESDEHPPIG